VGKPADPLIEPDLTQEELNTAKSGTQQSLNIVESNLAETQGKKLNSAQQDVVSKIHGFMETAREAIKNGDWVRARNLAKKAEVLSYELVAKP
jgi:exosome complex RNA-binding protein Csl4